MKPCLPYVYCLLCLWLSAIPGRTANFLVTSTSDSGAGSLRQAILDADASSGPNTINFQLSGSPPFTIKPTTALPALGTPTFINGTSQSGFSGTPLIELDGSLAGANVVGLQFLSASCTVRGLAINRFNAQGILLAGSSSVVQGCFIGTDTTGKIARGNSSFGIWIQSTGNLIGGSNTGDGNLISGGNDTGIYMSKGTNLVQGNLIGVSITGTNALKNINNGIVIDACSGNVIGGNTVPLRNVVSGNGQSGIYLNTRNASGNVIQGNYLGVGISGSMVVSNAGDGITIYGAATNTIGGVTPGTGNVISGNGLAGIAFNFNTAVSNVVLGNFIGTDATGKTALGNKNAGVVLSAAVANQIGGTTGGAANVISGNIQDGIFLKGGAAQNFIQGNLIGLSAAGTNAIPNGFNGISISGAVSNIVGGNISSARNVISGNTYNGVGILQLNDTGNSVLGNYVGTDVTGLKSIGNTLTGIRIQGRANIVGGTTVGSGNVISANGQQGIYLFGTNGSVTGNVVMGNIIGLDATGASALGNIDAGVGITSAANNQIGGTSIGARNVLSGNAGEGIFIMSAGSTNNVIQGNYIGTDVTGFNGRGNTFAGITLETTGGNQIGGSGSGAGNVISGNANRGVYLLAANSNLIQGNLIGTKADRVSAMGNVFHGIDITNAANNIIGGTNLGAGNVFAFAQSVYAGVRVRAGAINNLISGNSIFSNGALGIDLGNNGVDAVLNCQSGVAVNAANAGQNYPVLTSAVSGNSTLIRGTLNSVSGKTYALEFFASPAGDVTSANGEGQMFLGQSKLTLGSFCSSNFAVTLPVAVPPNWVVSATATNPTNSTSEFSAWIPVLPVPSPKLVRSGSNQVSISWTNNGGNFLVQQTISLLPALWTTVTGSPSLANGFYTLNLPITNTTSFYRLNAQ